MSNGVAVQVDGDNVLFPQASFIAAGDGDSHMMFIQTVREIATCGWCPACLSEFADRADQQMRQFAQTVRVVGQGWCGSGIHCLRCFLDAVCCGDIRS